jgi:NAD(P)-dependent dehydrogenase (short-subunit alcohol dehydrogenase family)
VDIRGSVALVTGGASGLGKATAAHLTGEGARVVLVDLQRSHGEEVAEQLGRDAVFAAADIVDPTRVADALAVADGLGPLRVLVNCAGIGDPARTLTRDGPVPLESFRRTVEVNLIGTFNVIRLAAERIAATDPVDGERGVIVNTASVAAYDGQIGQAAYAAAKAGIVGMTLPTARDLARDLIRVVTIAPGIFDTPILAVLSDGAKRSLGQQGPHPDRLGQPEEFAQLVSHIIANPMLNGESIRLDGAIRMAPR